MKWKMVRHGSQCWRAHSSCKTLHSEALLSVWYPKPWKPHNPHWTHHMHELLPMNKTTLSFVSSGQIHLAVNLVCNEKMYDSHLPLKISHQSTYPNLLPSMNYCLQRGNDNNLAAFYYMSGSPLRVNCFYPGDICLCVDTLFFVVTTVGTVLWASSG